MRYVGFVMVVGMVSTGLAGDLLDQFAKMAYAVETMDKTSGEDDEAQRAKYIEDFKKKFKAEREQEKEQKSERQHKALNKFDPEHCTGNEFVDFTQSMIDEEVLTSVQRKQIFAKLEGRTLQFENVVLYLAEPSFSSLEDDNSVVFNIGSSHPRGDFKIECHVPSGSVWDSLKDLDIGAAIPSVQGVVTRATMGGVELTKISLSGTSAKQGSKLLIKNGSDLEHELKKMNDIINPIRMDEIAKFVDGRTMTIGGMIVKDVEDEFGEVWMYLRCADRQLASVRVKLPNSDAALKYNKGSVVSDLNVRFTKALRSYDDDWLSAILVGEH